LGVAGPDAAEQLSEDRMSAGSVDVTLSLVVLPESAHVLLFPSVIALHDVLVAHVEAHGTQLLFELRRDLGVAFPDVVDQPSEDRMILASVDVTLLLVVLAEGGHVLLFPSVIALHVALVAQVEAHGMQLLFKLGRDLSVVGPDVVKKLSKDRMRAGRVDVAHLLVVLPEGGHVRCQETLVRHLCFQLWPRASPPTTHLPVRPLCG
jgi:hypothetical protein